MASGATTDTSNPPRPVSVIGLAELASLAETARKRAVEVLRAVVGPTYPLERAAAAHAAIESRRTLGKTLLTVG